MNTMLKIKKVQGEKKQFKVLKTQLVPISRLQPSPYNPPTRTNPKQLAAIADSMERTGQIYPVVITSKWQIVEGHRRVEAARLLDWMDVLCVIVDEDAPSIYAQCIASTKRHSGNELLYVYLHEPNAVPRKIREICESAAHDLGRSLLTKICTLGHSCSLYKTAIRVAIHVGDKDCERVKEITQWLLRHGQVNTVRELVNAKKHKSTILSAINNDRLIEMSTK